MQGSFGGIAMTHSRNKNSQEAERAGQAAVDVAREDRGVRGDSWCRAMYLRDRSLWWALREGGTVSEIRRRLTKSQPGCWSETRWERGGAERKQQDATQVAQPGG